MGANKLRGKAYADFLKSLGTVEFSKYLDEHPNEIGETKKAMTEQELAEYRKAVFGNLPQEFIDGEDDEDEYEYEEEEESYLPEDTEDEGINEFNKLLNEHDKQYWEARKKGEPIRKTI